MSNFTDEIRNKLYNECVDIMSTYFSAVTKDKLENQNISLNEDLLMFFECIQINYDFYMLIELKKILARFNDNLNRDVCHEEIQTVNIIRGKLNIKKYFFQELTQPSTKRNIPCRILVEDYNILENRFLMLVVAYVLTYISDTSKSKSSHTINFTKSTQWTKIIEFRSELLMLLNAGDFKNINQTTVMGSNSLLKRKINVLLPQLKFKLKRIYANKQQYSNLVSWWESLNSDIYKLPNFPLVFYNSTFDNKLFEIWILEKIKKEFVNSYNMELVSWSPMWERTKSFIYHFNYTTNDIHTSIKIYFQKSVDLMWDDVDQPTWHEHKSNAFLRGNLDIIITFDDSRNYAPVLIDVKNIYYHIINSKNEEIANPSVSEKIYKMIGYLDNFYKKAIVNNKANALLIFKNDKSAMHEKEFISDDDKRVISIFTISLQHPSDGIKNITDYILNCFGLLSDRMKITKSFNEIINQNNNMNTEDDVEKTIINIEKWVFNSIQTLLRGSESEIEEFQHLLLLNTFGSDIWNYFANHTKKLLGQGEYLLNTFKNSTNIEYSMIGINLSKAIEMEIHDKFFAKFIEYVKKQNLSDHSQLVVKKIINNNPCTLGQVARYISNDCSLLDTYIRSSIQNKKVASYKAQLKVVGRELTTFCLNRNKLAHKDGIDLNTFMRIRDSSLGIGTQRSILKEIFKLSALGE